MRNGEAVRIQRILFDSLRSLCEDLGIHEGDVLHCRAATPALLLLDVPGGHTVELELGWARFVQVFGTLGEDAE